MNSLALFSSALLMTSLLTSSYALFNVVHAQTEQWLIYCLLFIFGGIAIGESGFFRKSSLKFLCIVSFFSSIALFFFGDSIIVHSLSNKAAKYAFDLSLILNLILSGFASLNYFYTDTKFTQRYSLFNLLAAFLVLFLLFFQHKYGFKINFLTSASSALLLLFTVRRNNHPLLVSHTFDSISYSVLFFSFLSGCFISLYFEIHRYLVYPNPIWVPLYLFLSFIFISIATYLVKRKKRNCSPATVINFSLLIFTAALISIALKPKLLLLLDVSFFEFDPYVVASFLITTLLFLPYLGISSYLPIIQSIRSQRNLVFVSSIGNILGLVSFEFFLNSTDTSLKLAFLFISISLFLVFKNKKKTVLIGLSVSLSILFLYPLDKKLIKLGAFLYHSSNFPSDSVDDFNSYISIQNLKKKNNQIAFELDFSSNTSLKFLKKIGLNSYYTRYPSTRDYLRYHVLQDFSKTQHLKNKNVRALVIGHGNLLATKGLLDGFGERIQVDLIDNFFAYNEQSFIDPIYENMKLSPKDSRLSFISTDALNFLANKKRNYDIIVWNLTYPKYSTALKLYSKESIGLIKAALSPKGVFLTDYYQNLKIDCLPINFFTHSFSYPGNFLNDLNFHLFTDTNEFVQNFEFSIPTSAIESCQNITPLTLLNPFWTNQKYIYGFYSEYETYRKAYSGDLSKQTKAKQILSFFSRQGITPLVLNSTEKKDLGTHFSQNPNTAKGFYFIEENAFLSKNLIYFLSYLSDINYLSEEVAFSSLEIEKFFNGRELFTSDFLSYTYKMPNVKTILPVLEWEQLFTSSKFLNNSCFVLENFSIRSNLVDELVPFAKRILPKKVIDQNCEKWTYLGRSFPEEKKNEFDAFITTRITSMKRLHLENQGILVYFQKEVEHRSL